LVGRLIAAPAGVKVQIAANNTVTVTGPKGALSRTFPAILSDPAGDDAGR
jgi:ribosomal protein L6P/L9E